MIIRSMALALPLAVFATSSVATGQEAFPEVQWGCRLAFPEDCWVSEHPDAQAKFSKRCAQDPEQCAFRPNGTIMGWRGNYDTRSVYKNLSAPEANYFVVAADNLAAFLERKAN